MNIVVVLSSIAAVIAGAYAAVLAWFMSNETRLVFRAGETARSEHAAETCFDMAHEDVALVTEDGVRLSAWVVTARAGAPWVLFLHGNAGRVPHHCPRYLAFHHMNLNVLALDYRGYGQSRGIPTEQGLYRDAMAGYRYLVDTRKVAAERIYVHGFSLGGAVGIDLATRVPLAALIVESSFTSVPDVGMQRYPFLPIKFIARTRFDALGAVARVRCPILFICSRDDTEIPPSHTHRLYEAANEPKSLLEMSGEHDDVPLLQADRFYGGIAAFLSERAGWRISAPRDLRLTAQSPSPAQGLGDESPSA
ncbi:MAG: alpha/beta fold hydrolase [Chitinivibrionales bacterium]|nr:alpha/beta fold hydrolase [Chitinivibrionales bacterium]